jgi:hypothetical protein
VSFSTVHTLPILVLLVILGVSVVRTQTGSSPGSAVPDASRRSATIQQWDPERLFVYALALAGLISSVYGFAGMLATLVASVAPHEGSTITNPNVRDRTSYYLASLIVGLPIWLGLWTRAQRRASASTFERIAPERRLYLGLLFGDASVSALFGFHTVLRVILTLPGASGADRTTLVRAGIFAAARMVAWSGVWLYHSRLRRAEKVPGTQDDAHDLGLFALAGFSLAFLIIGSFETLHRTLEIIVAHESDTGSEVWTRWGGFAAWSISGAIAWTGIWLHDMRRRGVRPVRILYLRVAVMISAAATMISAHMLLYGFLGNALRHPSHASWSFLIEFVPILVLGAAGWSHHWVVVRRQIVFAEEAGLVRTPVAWPRRPLILLLAAGSLLAGSVALDSLLWLGVDMMVGTVPSGDSTWWYDRVSGASPALVMGGGIWLIAWSIAQRAVRRNPSVEGSTRERQRYLGTVVIVSTLIALGFAVALAVVLFHALLGDGMSSESVSRCLKDMTVIGLALTVAGYHGSVLLRERPLRSRRRTPMRLLALVAPEADETLAEVGRWKDRRVDVVGHLLQSGGEAAIPLPDVEGYLEDLESRTRATGALLFVYPDGVTVFPFHKDASPENTIQAAVAGQTIAISTQTRS